MAREFGLDIADVRGSGPSGRVRARDLQHHALESVDKVPTTLGYQLQDTRSRATVAARLTEAWKAPAFQLTISADASRLKAARAATAQHWAGESSPPTLTDFLIRVTVAALRRHPKLNATYDSGEHRVYEGANIGLAVAGPRGLAVPVIRSAGALDLRQTAAETSRLIEKTREGRIGIEDLLDGTFTISNLGMYGVDAFTAVLNPPQVAILAIGATREVLELREGEVIAVPTLAVTLTCDHRAVDGADGAQFLQTFKRLIEEPALAL